MPSGPRSVGRYFLLLRKIRLLILFRRVRPTRLITGAILGSLPEIELPPESSVDRHSWHLYTIRLNLELLDIDRGEFIRELHRRDVGASVHFIPIPLHPLYGELATATKSLSPRSFVVPTPCIVASLPINDGGSSGVRGERREKYCLLSPSWAGGRGYIP